MMAKRHAEDSLEETFFSDSPASKKARVDHHPKNYSPLNGYSLSPVAPGSTNGQQHRADGDIGNEEQAAAESRKEESNSTASRASSVELEEDKSAFAAPARQTAPLEGYNDLYLDTVNRSVLDFDFEKLCSVTLSNINVYACLICGKYYQGRGPRSHAYFHALEVGHHVYVNMQTKRVYVLPEGYEVKSKSLDDIKFVVDPQLSRDEVAKLDKEAKDAWDLSGKKYRPGMMYLLSSVRMEISDC